MNAAQIITIIDNYQKTLKLLKPQRAPYDLRNPSHAEALGHAVHMCDQIKGLVAEKKLDKAHRWLGFLQGILWTQGIFTIDEMRAHNT